MKAKKNIKRGMAYLDALLPGWAFDVNMTALRAQGIHIALCGSDRYFRRVRRDRAFVQRHAEELGLHSTQPEDLAVWVKTVKARRAVERRPSPSDRRRPTGEVATRLARVTPPVTPASPPGGRPGV